MRIFVTGSSGFLGSHLIPLLYKEKHQVLLLSRTNKSKNYINGNLGTLDLWKSKLKKFKPDVTIHLAWEGVANYNTTPPDVALRNIVNSVKLDQFLGQIGCKRFVALGSAIEYAKDLSPFSVSKMSFKVLGEAAANQYGMEFFWATPFYIYGPGQREEALLPHTITALLHGADPDIKNPNTRQDFVYVEDVAKALLLIAKKGKKETSRYQIGSGKPSFVGNLLNIVNKKLGLKENYLEPKSAGNVAPPLVANTDALNRLGWVPEISLEEGVEKTVDYYRNKLS
ncbi:MAG: NAD-dependent epimerase/dehydratase [Parcubacteria group bacterium GW2011_GWA2_47_12]|uniref:NAD-dependent epimerase/dehydratase domain-containing protein n=1 Tax=Candidatus Giovannonibacteria bacterium RIFCSPLOWO2_01_FULL_44_16 TaxID=1798348 RepID=A0A1F5X1I1_9BACT|nr:MAG: NAD-dependent epimerase/dehydratase [Parcubacteria group bacterium GW2011_GWA2_47_12]OGF81756.1 MAG: hypothetical protein A2924_00930 [Candidatus Giovannonibacteria bacterium RIFCSPLOWO2_01_FULL_44_16]